MTTATAKTLQIYLPTGEPRGIRIAEITTRIVKAVLISRSDLPQGKLRNELDLQTSIFCSAKMRTEAKPIVYIGQTEDARKRLDSHNKRFIGEFSGSCPVADRSCRSRTRFGCGSSALQTVPGQRMIPTLGSRTRRFE